MRAASRVLRRFPHGPAHLDPAQAQKVSRALIAAPHTSTVAPVTAAAVNIPRGANHEYQTFGLTAAAPSAIAAADTIAAAIPISQLRTGVQSHMMPVPSTSAATARRGPDPLIPACTPKAGATPSPDPSTRSRSGSYQCLSEGQGRTSHRSRQASRPRGRRRDSLANASAHRKHPGR